MATYNGEKFLREQLDSILAQSYRPIEVVVVDDASSDSTMTILENYSRRDGRVRVYASAENRGSTLAFERALELCDGEYIALSDQDDVFVPYKIDALLRHVEGRPTADLLLSDLIVVDDAGARIADSLIEYQQLTPVSGRPFGQLAYVNFVTGCATMITRRLKHIALPFPKDCITHDWWLAVIASSSQAGGIALLEDTLTLYRQHGHNLVGAHSGTLKSAIARAPDLDKRCQWYTANSARITGYMIRGGWDSAELAILRELKDMFDAMAADGTTSLQARVASLPTRMKYARTQGAVHALAILTFALWPQVVDRYKDIIRAARGAQQRSEG